jgi:uncharacterized repeat protein (TIGR01451 family)
MNSPLLRHLTARLKSQSWPVQSFSSLALAALLLAAPVAALRAGGGNEPAVKGGGNNTGPAGTPGQTVPVDLCAGAITGGPAGGGGIALPLASVGKEVGWKIGPEDYRLVVPAAAAGRETSLEVYSPEINLNDYANKRNRIAYYGDEVYAKGASVVTKFTLKEALKPVSSLRNTVAGRQALAQAGVLSDKRYSLGNQHSWDKLFAGTLEPGVYPLNIQTFGLGKNAFALRATNGMRVEASQFGVTARGACNQDQLVGFIPVGKSALGKKFTVSNYDADGNSELILTAVLPDGSRRRLTSSGDTKWAMDMFKIGEKDLGQWKILARIQPTTQQYSNSFEMRLELDGKPFYGQLPGFKPAPTPPPPVAKIGKLEVKSVAVVCEQRVPLTGTGFNTAGKAFTAPIALELPVGSYDVTPQALAGASVEPVKATVTDGQTTAIELAYKVENTISLEPEALELQIGETGIVTATVSNGFATPVPASVKITLPEGVTAEGPTEFTGNVSSTQPLKVSVPVKADAPVSGTIEASLEKDCGAKASSEIVVLGTPEIEIEKTVDQDLVKAGDQVNFTITVTNVGNATAEDVLVEDELPAGLEGENLSETITLEPGASQTFELPATVAEDASDTIDNTATATLGETTVDASAGIVIEPPPGPPVIEIDKSVDQDLVSAGDEVNFTIIVTNTGESIAEDVLVEDELPAGLEGENLSETITLTPGESQTFELPATVAADASDTIDNTATATLGENTVDSSASIVIEPPPVAPAPQADVSISKDVAPILAAPGDEVEYTLVIENNGPDAAEDVIVSDSPPEGLEITDVSSDVGTAEVRDGAAYAELGTLEAGANATITVTAKVTATEEGYLENTATVETSTPETDLENNESPAALEIRLPEAEPQKGILDFTSVAQACNQSVDFPSNVTINGQTVSTDEQLELEPGEYTVEPEAVQGSTAEPVTVTVTDGETTTADVVYQTVSRVTVTSSDENIKVGDEIVLEATAETDFAGELPGKVTLELPAGLESQDELTTEGTYSADSPLVLTVVAKATKPMTDGVVFATLDGCDISENVVINATKVVVPLPPAKRESQITSLAKVSEALVGSQIIIANKLPAGATYIPGSSRQLTSPNFDVNAQPVDGMWNASSDQPSKPISDPWVSGDTLFWALPADGMTYGVTYRVAHEGAITFPPNCRAVILAIPGGSSANQYRENGLDPSSAVGKLIGLGEYRLLQGDKVYLAAFATARPAELGAARVAVGGPATAIRIVALRNTTEPVDQPSLLIEAFDAEGNPANDEFVTLTTSPEPYDPDASAAVGYQAKLVDGSAIVRLQPVGPGPGRNVTQSNVKAEARITNGGGTVSSSATFRSTDLSGPSLSPNKAGVEGASRGWIIVGNGGLGVNYGAPGFTIDGSLKAFARGPIFNDILLTAAVNQGAAYNFNDGSFAVGGSLNPFANPYQRFPLLGDSSRIGQDARSGDGFYVRLEKGLSNLTYGTVNPGFQGLLTGYQPEFTGVTGNLNAGIFNLRGFAAYVPNATQFLKRQGDGTSIYRTSNAPSTDTPGASVVDGSERISVVTYDRNAPSLRLEERLLARGADYTIDYASGTVSLTKPIYSSNENGNPVFLEMYYASAGPAVKSDWRYGAQAGVNLGGLNLTGTYIGVQPSLVNLFGIGASYAAQGFGIALEGTQSGGKLGVAGRLNVQSGGFEAQIRYQDLAPGYIDPTTGQPTQGRALTAGATIGSPDGFSLTGRFAQNVNYNAGLTNDAGSLEARYSFGRDGFTIAAGLLGNVDLNNNVQIIGSEKYYASLGIQAPLGPIRLGLTQRLGLNKGTDAQTLISVDYALSPNFGIRLADTLTYETAGIRQQLSLGARGSFSNTELLRTALGNTPEIPNAFGTTNIAASYDLDTVDGNASRARVGVDTNLPLSTNFSLLLGAEATLPAKGDATYAGNFGVLYSSDTIKGSARAGYSLTANKLKQVYTLGGIFQPSDTLAFSPSLEYTVGGPEGEGGRFSIAGAIRQDDWTLVTNNTGKFGFYAPKLGNNLEGEVRFGYQAAERLFLRAGFGYGITGPQFIGQIGGGLTYYFTDTLGLGLNAAYQFMPAFSNAGTPVPTSSNLVLGIEGSLRLLTGLNLNAGFNIGGSDNGVNPYLLSPGFYVRLEWKFDERTFGR